MREPNNIVAELRDVPVVVSVFASALKPELDIALKQPLPDQMADVLIRLHENGPGAPAFDGNGGRM